MSPVLSVVPLTSIVVEPSTPPAVSDNPPAGVAITVSSTADSSATASATLLVTDADESKVPSETSTETDRLYFEVGGPLWSQDGMYTISAHQGAASNYQTSAEIEIIDGHVIPEFGVIAAMILAVAIVSIIVVTAKTRLSIVPRY